MTLQYMVSLLMSETRIIMLLLLYYFTFILSQRNEDMRIDIERIGAGVY